VVSNCLSRRVTRHVEKNQALRRIAPRDFEVTLEQAEAHEANDPLRASRAEARADCLYQTASLACMQTSQRRGQTQAEKRRSNQDLARTRERYCAITRPATARQKRRRRPKSACAKPDRAKQEESRRAEAQVDSPRAGPNVRDLSMLAKRAYWSSDLLCSQLLALVMADRNEVPWTGRPDPDLACVRSPRDPHLRLVVCCARWQSDTGSLRRACGRSWRTEQHSLPAAFSLIRSFTCKSRGLDPLAERVDWFFSTHAAL